MAEQNTNQQPVQANTALSSEQEVQNKKRSELAMFIISEKGVAKPEEQDAEIAKMAADCPEATAAEEGLVTDIDKAYKTMQIIKGNQDVGTQVPQPSPIETFSPGATQPTPTVSTAEDMAIAKTLLAQRDDRTRVSANTSIDKLIFDRPAPADIIPKGTQGYIQPKSWENIMSKINSGEYTVKEDDGADIDADKRIASTTNFNALKEAFAASKPVDVMVGGLNTKPIGYIVRKGSVTGSSNKPEQMTRAQLENFLVLNTAGYVTATDTLPGVKLRYVKAKADPKHPGMTIPPKTLVADANKKEAIKAGSYVISKEVTGNVESTNCKSALAFRVILKDKTMADHTTPLTRTVRVTLKADLPTLTRIADYVDVFGTGERDTNQTLLTPPSGDQAKDIEKAQRLAIAMLRKRAMDPSEVSSVMGYADQLKQFDVQPTQSPSAEL